MAYKRVYRTIKSDIENTRLADKTMKVMLPSGYMANFRFDRGELYDDVPEENLHELRIFGFRIEGEVEPDPVLPEIADHYVAGDVAAAQKSKMYVPEQPKQQVDLFQQLMSIMSPEILANAMAQAMATKMANPAPVVTVSAESEIGKLVNKKPTPKRKPAPKKKVEELKPAV